MLPISRKQAKEQGLRHYFTGVPCKNGHVDKLYVSSKTCVVCERERKSRDSHKYLERVADYKRMRRLDPDYQAQENAAQRERYHRKDPQQRRNSGDRAKVAHRRKTDPEYRDKLNAASSEHKILHPELYRAYSAKRRALKLEALLPDRDKQDAKWEREIAAEAQSLTISTGIVHHVDHIVALKGRDRQGNPIRGPHVWWNMRAIPASDNLSKTNWVMAKDIKLMLHDLKTSGAGPKYVAAVRAQLGPVPPSQWILPDYFS